MAEVNREYKDRLFRFIFGNPENRQWTLSLYNAIRGADYRDPDLVEFNTIDDAVYLGMKNDVSFIIRHDMYLWEHQSTYNPNMPMRYLIYVGHLFEKIITVGRYRPYSRRIQKVPRPHCICFYNGTVDQADREVLRLSDAYLDDSFADADAGVEVCVTMININFGKNPKLLDACRPLYEYSWLVDRVRTGQAKMGDIDQAVDTAFDEMPDDYVIKPVLMAHRSEVKNMFLTEYDQEKVISMEREEAREEGREEGREELQVEVATKMLKKNQPVSFISQICDLSESRVRTLAAQLDITVH